MMLTRAVSIEQPEDTSTIGSNAPASDTFILYVTVGLGSGKAEKTENKVLLFKLMAN